MFLREIDMKEERTSVEEKKRTAQSAAKKIIKAAQVPVRRLLLKIIFAALLLGALGVGAYFGRKKITEVKLAKKYMRIERQLVLCRELVTVKLRYSEIVSIKKRSALGVAKSYSIVKYSGVARGYCRRFEDRSDRFERRKIRFDFASEVGAPWKRNSVAGNLR